MAMPVVPQVDQLNGATLMVGDPEWVKFENYPIPSSFIVRFHFRDGKNHWAADFSIAVSENGTPKLFQVTVLATLDDGLHLPRITRENFREINGVERWQLKIIEQHRFDLLEMAIALAITMQGPKSNGGERIWTSKEGSLTAIELKEVTSQIHKRIRQRITPEFLQDVANIYTNAVLKKENPIEAIAERFQCAHRTAQEYATKARKEKRLPPTSPGKVTVKKPPKRKER